MSQGKHKEDNVPAGQTPITVSGNLVRDPELRFTPAGTAVARFTVASTERAMNADTGKWEDAGTSFLTCSVWREQAEHLIESARQGTRVIVTGALRQRSWTDKETGAKRSTFEVTADEVALSLKWTAAKVDRPARASRQVPEGEDPWASAEGGQGTDPEPPAGKARAADRGKAPTAA